MEKNKEDYISVLNNEDLAKLLGMRESELESILEEAKKESREFYQDLREINSCANSLYGYLQRSILDSLLKKRGLLKHKDFLNAAGLEKLTFGFDSPTLQKSRAKTPIYLGQDQINQLAGSSSGQVLGAYDPRTDQIYLVDWLQGKAKEEVYFHEMTHRENPHWSEGEVRNYVRSQGYSIFH